MEKTLKWVLVLYVVQELVVQVFPVLGFYPFYDYAPKRS